MSILKWMPEFKELGIFQADIQVNHNNYIYLVIYPTSGPANNLLTIKYPPGISVNKINGKVLQSDGCAKPDTIHSLK